MRAEDVDQFVETIRGYHLELMQIDRGPFVAQGVQTQLGEVLLGTAQYGRALLHSGEPPSARMTFVVGTSKVRASWQGRSIGPDDLLVGTHRTEIDLVSQAGYGVATASFPLEFVEVLAERLGYTRTAQTPTSLVVGLPHDTAELLRTTFDAIFNDAIARPLDKRAAIWAFSKQEDLLRALLRFTSGPLPVPRSVSNHERARVLKAALAAINERPDDVLTVGDLCRIAKASERTLHYAFTERFGLAPAHYMKALRLNGARKDLSREHETFKKIADIANKWGFWHLGQFAKDYRSLFGELPSDTYQRKHSTRRNE